MPGNIVQINGSKELEWYVGDSQMEALIAWLSQHGTKEKVESEETE